ncbi:helix-turn-helix transcriptional regulator [Lacrimispora defluvii]|uniref:Helix-turn-helix transcriptional regulator n=1 Tax=Lacrimispora defluvii TaxID=2719233 RepID=A0ABX1VXM1_9FIRM|nr:helix-turn-helix transcriptional regulator [Lacrimispora defluvii]NNJ32844.1 helix-turn-helix transcriptional regulator [Lacrimispora defluvii]
MRKKSDQQQMYYFSDKLKRQLVQIPHYPLTIVEAPSGFGKTTAVREFLKENLPQSACEFWYTCLGEPTSMAWMGICDLLSNVNDKVADALKKLKMPTLDTLYYMTTYLRDVHCQTETYLIVDNYQLVDSDIPRELISVFSMHGNPNLHMIFITQQLEAKQQITIHNNHIHTIDASSFFFDREGTASLFRMEGIRLTDDELEKIFMSTEGWVSAIRLQIINYIETGSFTLNTDIEQLVETAIWNKLTQEEEDFLLSVSVLDSFTVHQAAIMTGKETLPEAIQHLLKYNDFIRYIPDQHLYSIHSILRDYVLNRFHHHKPKEYQKQVIHKAGVACAAMSQYYPASKFFYKVRDFDAILSLPFGRDNYLDRHKENNQSEFIATIIKECPDEILRKYPFTMIIFGHYALMNGQTDAYLKLDKLLDSIVQNEADFNQEELQRIKGEYILMTTLGDLNDITKTTEGFKRALEFLGKPSTLIRTNTLWMYNSVLNMHWRESGELENELRQADISASIYCKLTQGHGSGFNIIMRAEAMLMRGEDDEAEILCHKALYEARSYQQTGICISAELVLSRIAILRGDVGGYFAAIKNIQDYTKENSNRYILRMAEHCMSIISLLLGIKDYVAPWLYDMESIKRVLYAPVVPNAQMLYLKLLLMEKRYNEFYGICQLALDESRNPSGNKKHMMQQVYQLIFLAIAKRNNGKHLEAQGHLREALNIALPDQIYLPFAQQEGMEDFLLELNIRSFGSVKSPNVSPYMEAPKIPAMPLVKAVQAPFGGGGGWG